MAADAIALAGRPRLATAPATAEVIDRFRAALAAWDIVPPESIIADSSIHRCDPAIVDRMGARSRPGAI